MAAPVPVLSYVCDWLPYRRSNAYYRTLAAAAPEDWSGTALTNKADDTSRFAEIAANLKSTWTPVAGSGGCEVLALLYLKPGTYGTTVVSGTGTYAVRINCSTGTVDISVLGGGFNSAGALPAAVWTSSSNYTSCWVRLQCAADGKSVQARVWAVGTAEPGTWPYIDGTPSGGSTTWAPSLGWTSGTSVSACRWFAYGSLNAITAPRMLSDPAYYDKWFATAAGGAQRVLTAEIYVPGYDGSSTTNYTTAVLRVASQAYEGGAAWPYTNQVFAEGLTGWPTMERKLSDDLFGRQQIAFGDMVIANPIGTDGKGLRDDWLRAKVQKAIVVLRYGDPLWPWFDHRTILTGEVTDVIDANGSIQVRIRDLLSRYDRPVVRSTLTTGANAGRPTPICIGSVFNVAPPVVDAANLLYRVGEANINALTDVRDKGVSLATTTLTMQSWSASGDYLRFSTAHGLQANDQISLAGSPPAPLVAGTVYFVKTTPSADTVTLSATAGGSTIDITASGGEMTIIASYPGSNLLETASAHGLAANDPMALGAGCPGGYTPGTTYYVSATGLTSTRFALSATPGGAVIAQTTAKQARQTLGFSWWRYAVAHGYADNAEIVTGSPVTNSTPITADTRYWVLLDNTTDHGFRASSGGARIAFTGSPTATFGETALNVSGYQAWKVQAVTVTVYGYVVDAAAATFKLSRNPAGQITCDLQGQKFAGVYSAKASHAVKVLIGTGDPLVSTVLGTGVGYDNYNWVVGVWIDAETNLADVLDLLARSCGSAYGVNRLGTLTATAFFDGYGGTPTATLAKDQLTAPLRMLRKFLPVDYYEGVRIAYGRNWTVQKDADLAGSVSTASRATFGAQWQYSVSHQGGSGNLAGLDLGEKGERRKRPAIETALTTGSSTNANSLRDNLVVGPAKQQAVFETTAKWTALDQFQVARAVSIQNGRFGWTAGKSFLVIGTKDDLWAHKVGLTLLTDLDGHYPVTT